MLTFQVERWNQIRGELDPVMKDHWEEMPFDPALPLRLDEEFYAAMDRMGKLHVVTARDGPRLVGYFIGFLCRHPHYEIQVANMDVYFLLPEYRKAANGVRLFMEFEKTAKARGVGFLLATARSDQNRSAELIFERLGWKLARALYSKRIGG